MLLQGRILAFVLPAVISLLTASLVTGCAATGVREVTRNKELPRQHELASTPFFPQELYQCGPAALATTLNAIDIKVTPEQLTPEVYIPSRQGSLQIEMLAAARRHGAIPYVIPPRLEALLKEIAAGNNVLVMQNLGLSFAPSWHYAVVVGYNLDRELIWLRSGTYERFEMTLSTFERTWARSQHWAFVAKKPGELPVSIEADSAARTLVAFEKNATPAMAVQAYKVASARWPDNLVLAMGLGNAAYRQGDLAEAHSAFEQATQHHPESAAAHNNLASVLMEQGQLAQAKTHAEQALKLASDENLKRQVQQTLDEIAGKSQPKKSP
jgi:tetratricopeptide (TPR) repeat protein